MFQKRGKIIIFGEPVPMSRPRVVKRGRYVHTFNPRKMMNWERLARLKGRRQYLGNRPIDAHKPISVMLLIYRSMPKSKPKKWKRKALNYEVWPSIKPDIDNYGKSIIDSQNGVIWYDDNQIVHENMWLFYSDRPRVEIYWNVITKNMTRGFVGHQTNLFEDKPSHSDKWIYNHCKNGGNNYFKIS